MALGVSWNKNLHWPLVLAGWTVLALYIGKLAWTGIGTLGWLYCQCKETELCWHFQSLLMALMCVLALTLASWLGTVLAILMLLNSFWVSVGTTITTKTYIGKLARQAELVPTVLVVQVEVLAHFSWWPRGNLKAAVTWSWKANLNIYGEESHGYL